MSIRRVIIVGGGFGGVTLAQHLERKLSAEVEIALISSANHFLFTPMLIDLLPVVSADGSGMLVGALSPTVIAKKALSDSTVSRRGRTAGSGT